MTLLLSFLPAVVLTLIALMATTYLVHEGRSLDAARAERQAAAAARSADEAAVVTKDALVDAIRQAMDEQRRSASVTPAEVHGAPAQRSFFEQPDVNPFFSSSGPADEPGADVPAYRPRSAGGGVVTFGGVYGMPRGEAGSQERG